MCVYVQIAMGIMTLCVFERWVCMRVHGPDHY